MPEALATSKRKFYKFLDSLSAPATSSPSTTTSSKRPLSEASYTNPSSVSVVSSASKAARVEPTAKRLRPSTSSTTVNSLRTLHARNASSTSLSSIRSRRTIAEGAKLTDANTGAGSEKKTPHFSPWSHETFLERLKTFASVTQWHPKPDAVNEVEWTKRGWQCVDVNTVGCKGGCGKRVIVRLDPLERRRIAAGETEGAEGDNNETSDDRKQDNEDDDEDDLDAQFETALVAKYKDLILEGHGESCLWRKAGCKDDIYKLPVVRTAIWQAEIRSRYTSLLDNASSITNIALATPDMEPRTALLLRDLPPHILFDATDTDLNNRALTLALTGWTAHNESRTPILSCDACFQRIGLWLYQPDYIRPPSSRSELEGDDASDARVLDPVEMHREHCPWRNGVNQAATGEYRGQPAWRILWSVVSRFADETRRRSRAVAVQEAEAQAATSGDVQPVDSQEEGEGEGGDYDEIGAPPQMSREEIQRLDKERITKLRKLKRMFSVKRKAPGAA